jgi:phospholipid/cholesterol/gamma-HCH transport system substrate-binding protein
MRKRRATNDRRRLWLGLAVVAVVAVAGWLSTVAINGLPWSSPYLVRLALPQGAPLLTSGDDVRIGGERVGQVQSVSLEGREWALATLALGSDKIGPGATARVRPRGLAGAVYVDLTPGRIARPFPSDSLIRATAGVQLTDVISGFDATARQALGQTLTGYGTGFAGQGAATGSVIAEAPALLSDTSATLAAIRPESGSLEGLVGDATTVAGALATNALGQTVTAARQVIETTGSHAGAIGEAIDALPGVEQASSSVLPSANTLLGRLTSASKTLQPGVAALADSLPGLEGIERGGPELAVLAGVAGAATPTLKALSPVLAKLIGPASGLTPLSTPVSELATVLIPYRTELIEAPLGFTRWGNFTYDFGTGAGHRAVRFSMVLTCALARDPYPAPGAASKERRSCP